MIATPEKKQSIREATMKTRYIVALSLLTGVAIGGSVIQGLHAQAAPPTYFVADVSAVTDPEALKTIGPKSGSSIAAFGGKYIARSENITPLVGTAPKRFVVIAFDSLVKAQAWYASAAQKEVSAIVIKAAPQRNFLVEGMPQ
jgi:uncharacterized protein (DUF1330 family)